MISISVKKLTVFSLIVQYVLLYIEEGCDPVNKLYYCDLSELPNGLEGFRNESSLLPFVKLVDKFDGQYQAIANDDTLFTFLTNKDAPKYKLVRVDLKEPNAWTDVIPESEKDVLESARAVNGNQLIVSYLSDVKYVLQVRDLETGSLQHKLPIDIGTVSEISARREDTVLFIGFTSFLTPGIIYQCDLGTQTPDMKIFREIDIPGFDRSEFHVNQVKESFFDVDKLLPYFKVHIICLSLLNVITLYEYDYCSLLESVLWFYLFVLFFNVTKHFRFLCLLKTVPRFQCSLLPERILFWMVHTLVCYMDMAALTSVLHHISTSVALYWQDI